MNSDDSKTRGQLDTPELNQIHESHLQKSDQERYKPYLKALSATKVLAEKFRSNSSNNFTVIDHKVCIRPNETLSSEDRHILKQAIKNMIPWRKGPFEIFGEPIDAEWRSDLKWQRLEDHIGSLKDKTVLDIGCNNGYYLYLMAKQQPKSILGIDPTIPYYLQYQFLSQFAPLPNTDFKLWGIQDLHQIKDCFDVIFCMGILYHHPDPIGVLKIAHQALHPDGTLIIETQGIHKEGPYLLLPNNRYTGKSGHWFIPSLEALENLIRRSGFQHIEVFDSIKLDSSEQRTSDQAPFDSLTQGLSPNNSDLTCEGYPAPWRYYIKARKRK